MAYADKVFQYDLCGDREILLENRKDRMDWGKYGSISLRKRWSGETALVSIELWGKESGEKDEDGDEIRYEDQEIVLTRDNAMVLATKLMRAVSELDADEYNSHLREDVYQLRDMLYDDIEKWEEKHPRDYLGQLAKAVVNFADTPAGKDAVKKIQKESDNGE